MHALIFRQRIMRIRILLWFGLALAMALLSPMLAHIGSWKEVRRWNAPQQSSFGHDRPIHFSVEQTHSYFDPLGLYSNERLVVSDGGYSYILNFDVPAHPSKPWIDNCQVNWTTDGVTFSSPTGLNIEINKKAILQQL